MKKFSAIVLSLSIFLSNQVLAQQVATKSVPTDSKESSIVKSSNPTNVEKIESDVSEALALIQENYVDNKINYNDLFKASIEGMLHSLDPHSNYFDAKEYEQFRTDQQSQYFGIGASIGDLRDADGKNVVTFIKATFENAPANRAGLRYGDKIVEVNGTSMIGKNFSEVRTFLRGPRGTVAKITVERYGTGKLETVEIIRDAVPQPSIPEVYMLRPGVGYIAMTGGFNQTTFNEFRVAMQELKSQGMTQLVLDLRNNGGGLVRQAYLIANTFLSRGQVIFTQKGRLDGVGETYRAVNDNPEKMPIVVLVNRNSASASEILAGALQDHDRALIVGENSFGKGLVQNPFMLEYGSMLLLTIAKYETPAGRLIQRDYSNGNLYDYYTKGGVGSENSEIKGAEKKTDNGRPVYSGGGIMPDEVIKPTTIPAERGRQQAKLLDSLFAYSLDLSFGKVNGIDGYRVDKPITYNYDLLSNDFVISDAVFQNYKKFAVEKYKMSATLIDKEKDFVIRNLRSELVTAAYGITTSLQVYNEIDNQLAKAVDLLPRAKILATEGLKAKTATGNNK